LREDALGFGYRDVDPDTGAPLDPNARFREHLQSTAGAANVFELAFYGAMNEWGPDKEGPEVDRSRSLSWRIPRRFFNAKIQSINLRRVGGFAAGSQALAVISLGGHAWIRSSAGTEKPPATATDPWNHRENIIQSQVLSHGPEESPRDHDRTVPAQVGAADGTKPYWGLFNQSPVRKRALALNPTDPVNRDVSLEDIDDIELDLSFFSHELTSP